MTDSFNVFLQQAIDNKEHINEALLLQEGFEFLKVQLQDYLQHEGVVTLTFTQAIKQAKRCNNSETDPRFWSALEAFYLAVGDHIEHQMQHKRWLRFVNIIETLQNYSGSQIIDDKKIHSKRIKRFYLAYTLAWEHLRYIAGNEDDYNPSELVLTSFSDVLEHEHH